MLVSPHLKQFQCIHKNISGFASNVLLRPWLPEWQGPEKRPEFDLYYNKLQRQFIFPQRGSLGVIHNRSLRIEKYYWPCRTLNSTREFLRFWSRIIILMSTKEFDRVLWLDDWRQWRQANCEPLYSKFSSSVIYIVQNLFHQGKGSRSISVRKNVLRKLLRISYRRLKAGFSVTEWLCTWLCSTVLFVTDRVTD